MAQVPLLYVFDLHSVLGSFECSADCIGRYPISIQSLVPCARRQVHRSGHCSESDASLTCSAAASGRSKEVTRHAHLGRQVPTAPF